MFIFAPIKADVFLHPVNPFVVWKLLRQVRGGSNLSPRERPLGFLERRFDRVSEVFVSHHGFCLSRTIPIGTLAFGADSRPAVVAVAGYPLVTTPLASIPHDCYRNSCHSP